jgi:glycosyltransferase involved in cell wall biosynthesis
LYTRTGISELIEAFQLIAQDFPQAHLYIVGEGPDRTMFEAMVQKCGELKHRIHFEGFQPEPQRYMLSTDIFVLASHREPFGLVLTEARETGCAIVATDVDGIPETLDYGEAGILVPPQDSQSLAYALIQLLSDRQKLQDWKLRGQKNLQRFSTTRMTEETLNIYSELRNKHHVFSSTNTR